MFAAAGDRDPLANMEIDPLRPLNNLLWGFVQDEFNRLTVRAPGVRIRTSVRADAVWQGGVRLERGRPRSKFLEAFHNLLLPGLGLLQGRLPDHGDCRRLPLLNALKEVHLVLAQGRAQPVWRSAVDGARGNAAAAVDAGAAGDPRLPAEPRDGSLQGSRGCRKSTP